MNLRVNAPEQKQIAVRDFVRRRLGSVAHELRVARTARMLFDLTRRWHGLGTPDCRLLVLAALLHDIGRAGGEKKHAQRGAQLILDSVALPLSPAERRRLAFLTRFHKGRAPAAGEVPTTLSAFSDELSAPALRILLALLRAADGLDSRSHGGPRLVITVAGSSRRTLSIFGHVEGDASHAEQLFARPKKFRLLEETLDCDVQIQFISTDAFILVG